MQSHRFMGWQSTLLLVNLYRIVTFAHNSCIYFHTSYSKVINAFHFLEYFTIFLSPNDSFYFNILFKRKDLSYMHMYIIIVFAETLFCKGTSSSVLVAREYLLVLTH